MTFNPEQFLSTAIDLKLDTKRTPVPEGEYKVAEIESIQAAPPKSGNEKLIILNIQYRLESTPILTKLFGEQQNVYVFGRINVSVDPETKKILGGANVNLELGQLRAAAGQEKSPWAPGMLVGAGGFKIRVGYRPSEDPENPWVDVGGWTKAK